MLTEQMMHGQNDMGVSIPADMIVVGKPASPQDAANTGFVDADTLKSIFDTAVNTDGLWSTGFMDWEFSTDQKQGFVFGDTVAQPWSK